MLSSIVQAGKRTENITERNKTMANCSMLLALQRVLDHSDQSRPQRRLRLAQPVFPLPLKEPYLLASLFNAVSTPDSYYTMQANAFLFQNLQRFPLIHLDLIVNPGKAMVAERKNRFLRKPVSFPEKTTKGEN